MKREKTKRFLATSVLISALILVTCFAFGRAPMQSVESASSTDEIDTALVGMWEMTVRGGVTYHYKYAISVGTWVTVGDIDGNFFGYRYSPTVGAYVKNTDGSYSYRERGWTYTQGGVCNGTFESVGTLVLDASGNTLSGPGVFTQFNLAGRPILTEDFTAVATRVGV